LIGTQSISLEATFELNKHFMTYARWETWADYIWFDEDANLTAEDASNIIEGWALFEDLPIDGLALQVGRIDFDHGREWVMDDQLRRRPSLREPRRQLPGSVGGSQDLGSVRQRRGRRKHPARRTDRFDLENRTPCSTTCTVREAR
jgi:hypothetical protein